METHVFIGGVAFATSFAASFFSILAMATVIRRRRSAMLAQGEGSAAVGLLGWRLRNGFGVLLPIAQGVLRIKRVDEFADEAVRICEDHGFMTVKESLLSVLMAAMITVLVIAQLFTRSVIGSGAVVLCVIVVMFVVAEGSRDKRKEEVREAIPNALESMAACFGSGFTLLQTFAQVAEEVPGKLGSLFARAAHVLETGGSAEQALGELRMGAQNSEMAFVAIALDVQHQSGGTLRQVLDAASDSVKSELALRRSLRVQTAQAKLSARVVIVMPFILMAVFSLATPSFLEPFFSSAFGLVLLMLAILMQAIGIVLVRRALTVDGVS